MSPLDWESLGIIYNPQTYKFIKKTDSGKYWIDPEELKKSQLKFSNYLKIFKCVFAALLVFIIIMFIIVIGSMIGIWSVGGIFSRNIFI